MSRTVVSSSDYAGWRAHRYLPEDLTQRIVLDFAGLNSLYGVTVRVEGNPILGYFDFKMLASGCPCRTEECVLNSPAYRNSRLRIGTEPLDSTGLVAFVEPWLHILHPLDACLAAHDLATAISAEWDLLCALTEAFVDSKRSRV